MKDACQVLPGVKFIGYVRCTDLPADVELSALANRKIVSLPEIAEITFFGKPVCECVTEKQNGGWMQSATLQFNTVDDIPFYEHLAFVVADANDKKWLIGSRNNPFPVIDIKKVSGAAGDSSAVSNVNVSLKAVRALMECES